MRLPILWSFQKTSCQAAVYPSTHTHTKSKWTSFSLLKNTVSDTNIDLRVASTSSPCWTGPRSSLRRASSLPSSCHRTAGTTPPNTKFTACWLRWDSSSLFSSQCLSVLSQFQTEFPDDRTCITHHTSSHYFPLPGTSVFHMFWFVSKLQAFGLQNPPQMRIGCSFPGANTHLLHLQPAFRSLPLPALHRCRRQGSSGLEGTKL